MTQHESPASSTLLPHAKKLRESNELKKVRVLWMILQQPPLRPHDDVAVKLVFQEMDLTSGWHRSRKAKQNPTWLSRAMSL